LFLALVAVEYSAGTDEQQAQIPHWGIYQFCSAAVGRKSL
jgi:hypothetical protein